MRTWSRCVRAGKLKEILEEEARNPDQIHGWSFCMAHAGGSGVTGVWGSRMTEIFPTGELKWHSARHVLIGTPDLEDGIACPKSRSERAQAG